MTGRFAALAVALMYTAPQPHALAAHPPSGQTAAETTTETAAETSTRTAARTSTRIATPTATPVSPPAGNGLEGPNNREDVGKILARIARRGAHETRFVEQRYLRFLDEPVESSGRLSYQPPDRLERITDKPKAEAMVLDGETLSMTRDGRTRSLSVSQLPAVGALVGSIRDLLAGDRAAIEKRYRVIAQGSDANWQLVLLPSDTELAALVTRIIVAGQAERMITIEIQQADGDRSLMTLQPS